MNFVNNIYFVFAGTRRKKNFLLYLPDMVDPGIGCTVNFDDIHSGAARNFNA
jgi:hypothetical protein